MSTAWWGYSVVRRGDVNPQRWSWCGSSGGRARPERAVPAIRSSSRCGALVSGAVLPGSRAPSPFRKAGVRTPRCVRRRCPEGYGKWGSKERRPAALRRSCRPDPWVGIAPWRSPIRPARQDGAAEGFPPVFCVFAPPCAPWPGARRVHSPGAARPRGQVSRWNTRSAFADTSPRSG